MPPFEPRHHDLASLFAASLQQNGSRPIFGTKRQGRWEWITYAEFGRMVDQARAGLSQLGVGAGDRVAIVANNRVEWAAAAYACYGLGAAYVPMYEAQQASEWQYILGDCGAKVALGATEAIAAQLTAMRPALPALEHVVCLDADAAKEGSFGQLLAKGARAPVPARPPGEGAVACFIYTSGTTGKPKGVLLTHRNLAFNVGAAIQLFPIMPSDRSLSFLPWAHAFGQVCELHTLVASGASLGICEGIPKIIDNLAEVQPTLLMAVPNIFHKIYDGVQRQIAAKPAPVQALFRTAMAARTKERNLERLSLAERLAIMAAQRLIFSKIVARFGGQLRYALSGGAALSPAVAEFVDNLGIMVFEGYGLTETSPIATVNTPATRRIGSVGKAVPGVRVEIDVAASSDAGSGEGEVVVHGHNVMQGYHNLPEETARVFTADGGFRTGDLGRFDKDGFLFITGRVKELYKLENGKYVAPVVVESRLQLSPYILQAMLYGANRPHNTAVLVPKPEGLREWAAANGIDAGDYPKLVADPRVRSLVQAEVDKVNAAGKGFEAVKAFVLADEEFTVANDMLTPKLSMKRRNILKRHEAALEALYAKA